MFFDVVMKVLIFIVSVIRVELPKITLHLFFLQVTICGCFVFVSFFFLKFFCVVFFVDFFSANIFTCSEELFFVNFFCALVIRVELKGSYLEIIFYG